MVKKLSILLLVVAALAGCAAKQVRQDQQGAVDALAKRQMQSRIFDTSDEKMVLSAAAATLQDFGFNLDESCSELGLITCSKTKNADNAKKVAANIGVTLMWSLAAAVLSQGHYVALMTNAPGTVPLDKEQKIRASLVSTPVGEKGERVMVRLIVQRVVVDDNNDVSAAETILDPKIYQEFFDKLAQSIFLEAHGV